MRPFLILNDVHLGVQRSAGTTPKSASALKSYLLDNLRSTLMKYLDHNIIFNGDVFDQFDVPLTDAWGFMSLCQEWLDHSLDSCNLILAEGNHDQAKNSANMCSLEFTARCLNSDRVVLVDKVSEFPVSNILIIPHVANQDMFNLELEKASQFSNFLILVHANYDNNFAVQSDHSLNVSEEQAKALTANNNTLLFGHEHQQRQPMKNVVIAGNQWPSSIADCLGNNSKRAHIFDPTTRQLTHIDTWQASENFAEIEWQDLLGSDDYQFVRVVGDCPTEQAAEMLAAISKYRQTSEAFVVSNAVKVAGVVDMSDLPSDLEAAKGFDVLSFLFENLDEKQTAVVKGLMEKQNA